MSDRFPVFTIGHGAQDFRKIADVLGRFGIATVIDVRSRPYSRHAPEFNKDSLAELATTMGFGYRWMGDTLGGLGDTPDPASFLASLHHVLSLARSAPVVLLCAEGEPSRCHRSTVLAPALEDMGARITHILPDGSTQLHQPSFDW
jgi:uncharacterized protein (DUF488 family)